MKIRLGKISIGSKIAIVLEFIIGCIFIILGMASKEILGITSGIMLWLFVIDMFLISGKDSMIEMLTILCDVEQEMLADIMKCSREEVDNMCTERLKERNEKSR